MSRPDTLANSPKLRAAIDSRVTDLPGLLEDQITLLAHAHDALRNEMTSGPGAKARALTDKDSKKLAEVSRAIEMLITAKIKLETHAKKQGTVLTQSELIIAASNKIKSLDWKERSKVIGELARYHDSQIVKTGGSLSTAVDALVAITEGMSCPASEGQALSKASETDLE